MSMRDLITGGATCAVPGSSAPANPIGALANVLLGPPKKQDLEGLPGTVVSVPGASSQPITSVPLSTIPGSEFEPHEASRLGRDSRFVGDFRGQGPLDEAWSDVSHSQFPHPQLIPEFDRIYGDVTGPLQPTWDGPPQRILSNVLHTFVDSGRAGLPFQPPALPMLGLSQAEKQCIRDRSCIMARHIFADQGEEYIQAKLNTLLQSLDIDNDLRVGGPRFGPYSEMEEYWKETQGAVVHNRPDAWAMEFHQQMAYNNPNGWAQSFENLHGVNGWATEFEQEQSQMAIGHARVTSTAHLAAMEPSRMLAETLGQNKDPKFQNSQFLQFVSKMSRGELIIDDNQVKPNTGFLGTEWANEYQAQHNIGSNSSDQFVHEHSQGANKWVGEFLKDQQSDGLGESWASEFNGELDNWGEEFGEKLRRGEFGESAADHWADEYLNEEMSFSKPSSGASRGVYEFSNLNPYVGHPNPLREGQDLFRKGLLSEAVLALEAEVLKNPDNAEGWRLLGITHAENDDDHQAIAAMMRAHGADPTNLEVLLALGVSHTNELEQAEALNYLYKWLQNHPKYGHLASLEKADAPFHADVARLFIDATQVSPEDADLHIVLGVLYNLSREYDRAIMAFKTALKIKPNDYSLWNKLGATQANSIQSSEAILAYQQALDLKPNYVRAWANMGISYANQSLYEESIRYYVRALSMNPKAENAWQYLRISLSNASRNDMLSACDSQNLDLLQKEFPL